jgi:hypothetical protein
MIEISLSAFWLNANVPLSSRQMYPAESTLFRDPAVRQVY